MSFSLENRQTSLPTLLRPLEFVDEFLIAAESASEGDKVGLASMQLAAQVPDRESVVYSMLTAMISAKNRGADAQVILDERYTRTMTRIGNRDYPNYLPGFGFNVAERRATRNRTDNWLEELNDAYILVPRIPHKRSRGYVPRLRHMGSFHVAQNFAAVHTKAAYVARTDGEVTAWLNTGNLTDSDILAPQQDKAIGMNNISLRVHGSVASFIMRAVTNGFNTDSGNHVFGERVKVIHDIGNSGEPARLPRILIEALEAIDPRRVSIITSPEDYEPKQTKAVVLLSQYAPNGLLFNALRHAAAQGVYVSVPLQPSGDHRSRSFPYNVNNSVFTKRAGANMTISKRAVPSHIKSQIVTYHDGTAKVVIGTDNFVTNLQKVVRNEEIAIAISLNLKDVGDADYFKSLLSILLDMQEIDESTKGILSEGI